MVTSQEVLSFWFDQIDPKQWWIKDDEFDQLIQSKFEPLYKQAILNELYQWRTTTYGRLAEIIVLDQFSRNMYRDKAIAFANDNLAVALTLAAIDTKADKELKDLPSQLAFLYMPLMHSESKVIHVLAEKMYSQPGLENNLEYEYKHKKIIDKFGRYPHRNKILDRESTAEELLFLEQPESSF